MKYIESILILRSLNFIRVKHNDALTYNLVLPISLTIILLSLLYSLSNQVNLYGPQGIIHELSSFLLILTPFYIAALAAISTFNGNAALDEPMKGIKAPTLVILVRGTYQITNLSLRHFLSLMFGYCSVLSLSLFLSNVFIRHFANNSILRSYEISHYVGILFFVCFLFFLMQLVTITLLGLYFLSDKLHRHDTA